jgi:hypothetical protein
MKRAWSLANKNGLCKAIAKKLVILRFLMVYNTMIYGCGLRF